MTPEQIQSAIDDFETAKGWIDDVMFYAVAGGNDNPEEFKRRSHAPKEIIYKALTQALEIAKGDKVVVDKKWIAKMMLAILESPAVTCTLWFDEHATMIDELCDIGNIQFESGYQEDWSTELRAMIAVAEGD